MAGSRVETDSDSDEDIDLPPLELKRTDGHAVVNGRVVFGVFARDLKSNDVKAADTKPVVPILLSPHKST